MVDIIIMDLFSMQDEKYRDFQSKLIPTVDKETIIGVRTPELKKYAKNLFKSGEYLSFLRSLPHKYYEENNLHAFLLGEIGDFDLCCREIDIFLPYINNWATCDGLRPKVLSKDPEKLRVIIERWITSEHCYTIRFGIEMLMVHFLDELFDESDLTAVASICSDEYYVNMMRAWYFATALAKQQKHALPYFERGALDEWTRNKAIQKARESFRINSELKAFLLTIK